MVRFTYLISPVVKPLTTSWVSSVKTTSLLLKNLPAWTLILLSFYFCLISDSILLLGVATVQIAFSLLIFLESVLKKVLDDPLKSRHLEMAGYCVGGVFLLLACMYQFSEAYISLQHPVSHQHLGVTLTVLSSITGNVLLVRLHWRSGLIRSRIRTFCQPLLGLFLLNLLCLFSSFMIQLTGFFQFDALVSLVISGSLFVIIMGHITRAYRHLNHPLQKHEYQ